MSSIFQRKNPAIEKLFAEAGSPKKVLCIPIDYAKCQHTALACNGEGMPLRGAFNIHNTAEGVDFLEDIIKGLCKKHSIRKPHVFFGGEDCTAFCYNFIHALLGRHYLGIGINAYEGAEARQNQLASTDKLDLLGGKKPWRRRQRPRCNRRHAGCQIGVNGAAMEHQAVRQR